MSMSPPAPIPPPMMGAAPGIPEWLPFRPPNPPWLYTVGILKTTWSLFVFAFLPYVFMTILNNASNSSFGFGVHSDLPLQLLIDFGVVLALLSGIRHVSRPTRWFGPIGFFRALIKVVYVLLIAFNAVLILSLNFQGLNGSLSIDYSGVIYLFLIGTALAMLAALVTAYEDTKYPGERLPFDYRVKGL